MSSMSLVWSVKVFGQVSPCQPGIARTISAAICSRRVGSAGQKSGGWAAGSQPLMMLRAASWALALGAGGAAGGGGGVRRAVAPLRGDRPVAVIRGARTPPVPRDDAAQHRDGRVRVVADATTGSLPVAGTVGGVASHRHEPERQPAV